MRLSLPRDLAFEARAAVQSALWLTADKKTRATLASAVAKLDLQLTPAWWAQFLHRPRTIRLTTDEAADLVDAMTGEIRAIEHALKDAAAIPLTDRMTDRATRSARQLATAVDLIRAAGTSKGGK